MKKKNLNQYKIILIIITLVIIATLIIMGVSLFTTNEESPFILIKNDSNDIRAWSTVLLELEEKFDNTKIEIRTYENEHELEKMLKQKKSTLLFVEIDITPENDYSSFAENNNISKLDYSNIPNSNFIQLSLLQIAQLKKPQNINNIYSSQIGRAHV